METQLSSDCSDSHRRTGNQTILWYLLTCTDRVLCESRSGFPDEDPDRGRTARPTAAVGHSRTRKVWLLLIFSPIPSRSPHGCKETREHGPFPAVRFRSIAKSYFRRADGVLLLYDVTCEKSFLNVREWVDMVEVKHPAGAVCVDE